MVTYQIFIPSFADSNSDGIGDINGIISALDYLYELGIDTIWLSPIHPSPSYHKYDVLDYYQIDPTYGSLNDFRNLILEVHKRGMKIIMDLVLNHCSKEHPWFKAAIEQHEKYRDYFIWSTKEEIEKVGELTKAVTADSDNTVLWNSIGKQEELYYSFFWEGMPDLNYDNPEVCEEAYSIGKYWLEMGVDGFRLDAAKHIFPDHRAEDCHVFWEGFKTAMQRQNPDVYLIGEVWTNLNEQAPFASGFSALFNFDLSYAILETVKQGKVLGASMYTDSWKLHERLSLLDIIKEGNEVFHRVNKSFISATFLSNHDQERVLSFLENDERKAKLAASILLTLPGTPYIYYGEEIGMKGSKPDEYIREPFLWSKDDERNTQWLIPKYNQLVDGQSLDIQQNDSSSIYSHYKNLIGLRKSSNALTHGELVAETFNDESILAYLREYENSELLVIHNLSSSDKEITLPVKFSSIFYTTGLENEQINDSFVLKAYQSLILTK